MGKFKQMLIEQEEQAAARDTGFVAIVCGDAEGNATLVTTPENLPKLPRDEDDAVELYCIRGRDWEDVMSIYYELEGRGTYKPMEN